MVREELCLQLEVRVAVLEPSPRHFLPSCGKAEYSLTDLSFTTFMQVGTGLRKYLTNQWGVKGIVMILLMVALCTIRFWELEARGRDHIEKAQSFMLYSPEKSCFATKLHKGEDSPQHCCFPKTSHSRKNSEVLRLTKKTNKYTKYIVIVTYIVMYSSIAGTLRIRPYPYS